MRAERQAPEATPDPYAAIEQVRGTSPADPDTAIENVRAVGREAPEPTADPYTGIENVRAGAPAAGDPYAGIENARAEPRATEGGGGGIDVSAPSPEAAAGLAGAAVLTLAGAAVALRKRRAPRPAGRHGPQENGPGFARPIPYVLAGLCSGFIKGARRRLRKVWRCVTGRAITRAWRENSWLYSWCWPSAPWSRSRRSQTETV